LKKSKFEIRREIQCINFAQKLNLGKQKSSSLRQLITLGWLILLFSSTLKTEQKIGRKIDYSHPWNFNFLAGILCIKDTTVLSLYSVGMLNSNSSAKSH
jgi:hypothetical protein